jgi:hypothetical protein
MSTEDKVLKALKKSAEKLTPDFRQDALTAGWPADIVYQLSVDEVDGNLEIVIPDSIKAKVEDLEYGSNGSSNRVIYRFERAHTENAGNIYETTFEDIALGSAAFR